MVGKQIVIVLLEYLYLKVSVRRKIRNVKKLFKQRFEGIESGEVDDVDKFDQVAMADLKIHEDIEKQICMKEAKPT